MFQRASRCELARRCVSVALLVACLTFIEGCGKTSVDNATDSTATSVLSRESGGDLDPTGWGTLAESIQCEDTSADDGIRGLNVPGVDAYDDTLAPIPLPHHKAYVAVIKCGDGGEATMDSLAFITSNDSVRAVQLPRPEDSDRVIVERMVATDEGVTVVWKTTNGCCLSLQEWKADLTDPTSTIPLTPYVHDAVIDIDAYGEAVFALPDGLTRCHLYEQVDEPFGIATCGVRVTGMCPITLSESAEALSDEHCDGDIGFDPIIPDPYLTKWWVDTDFPSLFAEGYNGETLELAVLPVGARITGQHIQCTSEPDQVACLNTVTGHGFTVRHGASDYTVH